MISDPKFSSPVDGLTFKRGDYATLDVYFVSNGSIVPPLSTGTRNIIFGGKPSGKYDSANFIMYAENPRVVNDHYNLSISLATSAINSLLMVDNNDSNDVGSVSFMGEITWSDDYTNWQSTNTFGITVINDVIKGHEVPPAAWINSETLILSSVPKYPNDLGFTIDNSAMLTSTGILSAFRSTFSTTGTDVKPLTGLWDYSYYDGSHYVWKRFYNGSLTLSAVNLSSNGMNNPYDQISGWLPYIVTIIWDETPGIPGKFAVVAETDLYVCMAGPNPSIWTKVTITPP